MLSQLHAVLVTLYFHAILGSLVSSKCKSFVNIVIEYFIGVSLESVNKYSCHDISSLAAKCCYLRVYPTPTLFVLSDEKQ